MGEEVTFMKGKRHSPEQIVRKLREADRLLAEGADVDAVCRHLEVSVQTYQRWRSQFKAMRPEDVVRLKALEKEASTAERSESPRSILRVPHALATRGDGGEDRPSIPAKRESDLLELVEEADLRGVEKVRRVLREFCGAQVERNNRRL